MRKNRQLSKASGIRFQPSAGEWEAKPPFDNDYYEQTRSLLERAYLEAGDARGQSGFRGDEARWERARRPIVAALDRDGTFLDVGCANGLLMESLVV